MLRETREEIGLDLNSGSFIGLGQLNEAPIYGRGKRRQGSVYVPFVFLLCSSNETPFTLQEGEVLAARWVKLSHLISGLEYQVKTPFQGGPSSVGLDHIYWPSIDIPAPKDTNDSPTSAPLLSSIEMVKRENVLFRLWGMTLRATTELLDLCQVSRSASNHVLRPSSLSTICLVENRT